MNKRGDIFSLWLVMITLFMCGIAISAHIFQQGNLDAVVVSSVDLLKFEDRLDIYEFNEERQLRVYFCNNNNNKDDFVREMVKYSSLFFEDELYYNGIRIEMDKFEEETTRINFLNTIYAIKNDDDGKQTMKRLGVVRKFEVSNNENSKINFAMDVAISLDKEYVLDNDFCEA